MKQIITAAVLALAVSPGYAQDLSGWSDIFSPRQVLTAIVQYGIFAVRTQTNMTYSGLSIDPVENRATIYDVVITPVLGRSDFATCHFSMDTISIKGSPLNESSTIRIGIEVSGLKVSPACILQPPLSDLAALRLEKLEMPRMSIDLRYDLPSGQASVLAYTIVEGLGAVTVDADFHYLAAGPARGLSDSPVPIASLSSMSFQIEDGGLWNRVSPLLSEQFTNPATGPARVASILNSFRPTILGEAPSSASSQGFDAFAQSVQTAAEKFLVSPKQLLITTGFDPADPVLLDLTAYDTNPGQLFADLRPVVSVLPVSAKRAASLDKLRAAITNYRSLNDAERREIGLALLTGEGAPRNLELAIELLSGLPTAGEPDTSFQIAQALASRTPARAYSYAIQASIDGAVGATALLDEIEPKLDAEAIFGAQKGLDDLTQDMPNSSGEMRELAARYFDGRNGRSYVLASYWARLAAAAGDRASLYLLNDIEDRMAALGATSAWQKLEVPIADRAVGDWVSLDILGQLESDQ